MFKSCLIKLLMILVIVSISACQNKTETEVFNTEEVETIDENLFEESDELMLGDGSFKKAVYDVLDLEEGYDDYAAVNINLSEENIPEEFSSVAAFDKDNLVLKSGGIYVLSGTMNGKRVKIEKDLGDRVLLVLDNANINLNKPCAIYSQDDVQIRIHLTDSHNTINLKKEGKYPKDDVISSFAAINFDKSISFTGKGRLDIYNDFNNGVESGEDIIFINGEYNIKTEQDAIKTKHQLLMRDGKINLEANDDGIKVTSDKDALILIENGELNLKTFDKGFNSDDRIIISGGTVNVDAGNEAITAKKIDLVSGTVNIIAGDDGINSTDKNQNKKSNQSGVYTNLAGSKLNIDAKMDGIDSNGDLYIRAGEIFISAADTADERIIDYNGNVIFNANVEMLAVGPAKKMQDLGEDPSQNYIILYLFDKWRGSEDIVLKNIQGEEIISLTPTKDYAAALIASEKLVPGENYIVSSADKKVEFALSNGRTIINE